MQLKTFAIEFGGSEYEMGTADSSDDSQESSKIILVKINSYGCQRMWFCAPKPGSII